MERALVALFLRRVRRIAVRNLGDIEPSVLFIQAAPGPRFLSLDTHVYSSQEGLA